VASAMELLDVNMPAELYQGSCLHTVFDTQCALSRAAYAAAGVIGSGTRTQNAFPSNLSVAAGYYNSGTMIFTSGPNNGLRRTIKSQDASGNLTLVLPLPAAPGVGDTFTAYPGCDLSKGTCSAKFNNLIHFRGMPFIPVPETAI
jgi:uncharacterized phage protein (TIGR02218 family)